MNKKLIVIIICAVLIAILLIPSFFIGNDKNKVTFKFNNGQSDKVVEIDDRTAVSEIEKPTRNGYIFLYWQLDGEKYDFTSIVKEDITLEAIWMKSGLGNDPLGPTPSTKPEPTIKPTPSTKPEPTNSPIPTPSTKPTPTPSTKPEPTDSPIPTTKPVPTTKPEPTNSPIPTPTAPPIIRRYVVSFNTNGAGSIATQTVIEGSKATEPSAPTKSGYTFDGWYLNGQKYDFSTRVKSNITLEAKWNKIIKEYTFSVSSVDEFSPDRNLTFYENGKAISIKKLMFTDGVEVIATYNGTIVTANASEIGNESQFKIQLQDGSTVTANKK